jgi:hypothetical protein
MFFSFSFLSFSCPAPQNLKQAPHLHHLHHKIRSRAMSTTEEPTVAAVPVAEEPKKEEEAVANGDAGGAAESAAKKKRNRRKKKKAAAGGGAARTHLLLLAHVLKIGLFSSLFCLHLRFNRHLSTIMYSRGRRGGR